MNFCRHPHNKSQKKKYCHRPSPPYSASDFEHGTHKKGNNGQIYIVVTNKKGVNQWKVYKDSPSHKDSTKTLITSSKKKQKISQKSSSSSLILIHPFVQKQIIPNLEERGQLFVPGDLVIIRDEHGDIFLESQDVEVVNRKLETLTLKFIASDKLKQKSQIKFLGSLYPLNFTGKYAYIKINPFNISITVSYRKSFIQAYSRFQRKRVPHMNESGVIFTNLKNTSLLKSLYREVQNLITKKKYFYHPGSNKQVLDIVHPSLYPFVEDISKFDTSPTNSQLNSFKPTTDYWNRPYEHSKYQMLPSEFYINSSGKCQIKSYINNLPKSETKLYQLIEKLFEQVLPKFEKIWSYINSIKLYDAEIGPSFEDIDDSSCQSKLKLLSLKNKNLQVITKITTTKLDNGNIEGAWHVEGMSHEHIVASCVCVLHQDEYLKADLQFRRRFTICEGQKIEQGASQVREEFMYNYFTEPNYLKSPKKIDSPFKDLIPLGQVSTQTGTLTLFPNSHIHKLDLSSTCSGQERTVIVFWLVNPEVGVISTQDIKPQQQDSYWSQKIAEKHQLKFMKDRKYYKQTFNVRSLNLCEH
jgi:hypothetical protein